MPIQDYHAETAYKSKSMLCELADCPARYNYIYNQGGVKPKTKSLRLGNAVHVLALEPELWNAGYHVLPTTYFDDKGVQKEFRQDKRMQSYQDEMFAAGYDAVRDEETGKVKDFVPSAKAKTIITVKEKEIVERMAEAVLKHPTARALLGSPGYVESSIFWEVEEEDEETGVKRIIKKRCRPDDTKNNGLLLDIKTAASVKPEFFFKSASELHYDLSPALSFEGYTALHGKEPDNYVFIAVENVEPHLVEIYESTKPMEDMNGLSYLEYGQAHLNHLMKKLINCEASNIWPGYQDGIGTMRLPDWQVRKYFEKGEF